MKQLDKNWFSNGLIDLEYKQYILLDYIQCIRQNYIENKLFPSFLNLLNTFKSTQEFKNNLVSLKKKITTKTLIGIHETTLVYEETIDNNLIMDEIEKIIDYSLPIFKNIIQEGKVIYDFVEKQLEIETVGIEPLYIREGYLIIRYKKFFTVYRYKTSLLNDLSYDKSKILNIEEVGKYKSTLTNNVENVKNKLIKKYNNLPNPATYFIDVNLEVPYEETILPIIKRKFISTINI